jgi:hypothetical protein
MSTRHDALSPGNKLFRIALIETVDGSTGETTPIVSGTVTAFLAQSNDPDATTANVLFSVSATHVGVADGDFPLGSWLIVIPALSATLLDTYFNTTAPPYLIVVRANEARVYEKLHYKRSKAAVTA